MINKVWPSSRHDGSDFTPRDSHRSSKAGEPLPFRGAVLDIRGDWSEFANRLGFKSWATTHNPCFLCNTTRAQMTIPPGPEQPPWTLHEDSSYEPACVRCERWVIIESRAMHTRLRTQLQYSWKYTGRGLYADVPELGLHAGDRLEPSHLLCDISRFDGLTTFPCMQLFWKPLQTARVTHRNPLFAEELGISLSTLSIDALHTVHLGVMQEFLAQAIWVLLLSNVFDVRRSTQSDVLHYGLMTFQAQLMQYYRRAPKGITRVNSFTLGMIGTQTDRKLKTKAAETRWLLPFVNELLNPSWRNPVK